MSQGIATLLSQIAERLQAGDARGVEELRKQVLLRADAASAEELASIAAAIVDEIVLFGDEEQAGQAEPFYARVASLAEHRLGAEHPLTLSAKQLLASIYAHQNRLKEAAALTEQLLRRMVGQRGYDDEVLTTLGNLELWYRNAGLNAKADALRDARWQQLSLCEHLRPLEAYVLAAGATVTERGRWNGVAVSFDAYLDEASLRRRLSLAPCVERTELSDPHYGYARGLWCSIHRDTIWGLHPSQKARAPKIS